MGVTFPQHCCILLFRSKLYKERRLYKKLLGVSHRLSGKHSINHQGFKTNTMLNDQCYFIKAGLGSAFWTQDQGNLLTPSPVKWTYSLIYTFIHLPLQGGAKKQLGWGRTCWWYMVLSDISKRMTYQRTQWFYSSFHREEF